MNFGFPACFRQDAYSHASLGIDCHSCGSADIITQMRLALQSERARYNQAFLDQGKNPRVPNVSAEQAYNLGTILGARAVGMEKEIGSLAVGKLADVVVFDATSPSMICAAEQDPVAAIVLHASVRDVEMVIVDGIVRKEGGKTLPVRVEREITGLGGGEGKVDVGWEGVVKELLKSREGIEEKIAKLDFGKIREGVIGMLHVDESNTVNSL